MPTFRVRARQQVVVETTYRLKAGSPEQAEILCKTGQVAYDDRREIEGKEEWLETLEVVKEK